MNENVQRRELTSRRTFLKSSAAVAAGAATTSLPLAAADYAAGSDALRVGLVGCGGRGTGAAGQALHADKNVKLVAMADAFADRLQKSLTAIQSDPALASKVEVPEERRFVGFQAYKE